MLKSEVRALAAAEGLHPASKRSSAGICFIGRRSFGEFIEGYVPTVPGRFLDADTGADLGACANLLALTNGQRAPLGGGLDRRYVAGRDLAARVAWVAGGHDHPALTSRSALLLPARWVAGAAPAALAEAAAGDAGGGGGISDRPVDSDGWRLPGLGCSCQARYRQAEALCVLQAPAAADWRPAGPGGSQGLTGRLTPSTRFTPTRFMGGALDAAVSMYGRGGSSAGESAGNGSSAGESSGSTGSPAAVGQGPFLKLNLDAPLRGLAPGQAVVFYQGVVVLGSALLAAAGPTVLEQAAAGGCSGGGGGDGGAVPC
jgi:hypothetical protein